MSSLIEKTHDFWANLHPAVKWLLVGAVAAGLVVAGARPAYRHLRVWRSDRNAAEAQRAMAAGDAARARDLAMAALQLDAGRFDAIRVLGQAFPLLRDPNAQAVAGALLTDPRASEDDRLRAFETLVEGAPVALLGSAWNEIGPERQKRLEFRLPFIRRLIDQTHFSEAIGLLREADDPAANPALDLQWVRLLVLSKEDQRWLEAQDRARKAFEARGPEAARLVELLEGIPAANIDRACAQAAVEWAGREPDPPVGVRLAVEYLRQSALSAHPDADRRATVGALAQSAPAEVVRWLVRHGHADEAVAVVPPPAAAQTAAWFDARNQALVATQRWEEWRENLDKAPPDAPRVELACDRAIAWEKLGNTARRNAEWHTAMVEARGDLSRNAFLVLAERVERAGMIPQAEDAMVQAIVLGRGRIPLFQRLQPLLVSLSRQGRERELMLITTTLLGFEPGNPVLLTNHAYLACLSGTIEPAILRQRMEVIREKLPQAVPVRCVVAATWLAEGNPGQAAAALQVDGVDWAQSAAGYRAVYGATMTLVGRKNEADRVLAGLPWGELLPCERQFFDRMVRGASPSGPAGPAVPPSEPAADAAPATSVPPASAPPEPAAPAP